MATYLASIFGTEQDKVNCSFYYKIGACRHGDRCSRKHVKPSYSQTILMPNMYQNPAFDPKNRMNPSQLQNHFDAFYEDVWAEMCKYGELEELVVCENNNDRELGPGPFLDSFPGTEANVYTLISRSHWQCLRAIQVRRRCTNSLRYVELPLVCGATYILRAIPRHRFPRSMLSIKQRRGLHARRILQFHSPKGPRSRT